MQIEESFLIQRPPSEVWPLLKNIPEVATCLPGAEILEQLEDQQYRGRLKVKVGPMNPQFAGTARVIELNDEDLRGTIEGSGIDQRGGSRASGRITYVVRPADEGTRVAVVADFQLQGRIAQFGRMGVMRDVSRALTQEFAGCLERKLSAVSPEDAREVRADEIKAVRLFLRSLWQWLRRTLRRVFRTR